MQGTFTRVLINDSQTLRNEWAAALQEVLADKELTRKDLWRMLWEAGHEVSVQSVHHWCNGTWGPSPFHQAAVAAVLDVPHRILFPVPAVLAKKAVPAPHAAKRRGPRRRKQDVA